MANKIILTFCVAGVLIGCSEDNKAKPEKVSTIHQAVMIDIREPCSDDSDCRGGPSCAAKKCNTASDRCYLTEKDDDGDGHDAACSYGNETWGDDCDDDRPDRYPGNSEVCDRDHIDEDCDPSTVGRVRDSDARSLGGVVGGDEDNDGYSSSECENEDDDGTIRRGTDCDDTRSGVNPGAVESCNGVDDDCDGEADNIPECDLLKELAGESCTTQHYPDTDGDGHGDPDGQPLASCLPKQGYSTLANDCDDENPAIQPGNIVCAEAFTEAAVCTSAGSYQTVSCPGGCVTEANGTGRCDMAGQSCWDNAELSCGTMSCRAIGAECHRNGFSESCATQCEAIFACFQANSCTGPCSNSCGQIGNQNGGIGGTPWRTAATLTQCACQ